MGGNDDLVGKENWLDKRYEEGDTRNVLTLTRSFLYVKGCEVGSSLGAKILL